MPIYRVQNTLQDANGLSKDRYVNTFYVSSITPLTDEDTALDAVHLAVKTFYTAIAGNLASCVTGTQHTVRSYNMLLPQPRVPLRELTYPLTSTSSGLPNEVALALTLEGSPRSGVAPQSTRGRVYIGPCGAIDTASTAPNDSARPSQAFIDAVVNMGRNMINEIITNGQGLHLVVASTVQGKAPLPVGSRHAYEVVACSADDAWDTQRSRGNAPTARKRDVITTTVGYDMTW